MMSFQAAILFLLFLPVFAIAYVLLWIVGMVDKGISKVTW